MKKLLILSPQKSYPAIDGGKIGILYPLLEFAKRVQVYHCFISDKPLTHSEETFFKEHNINIFPCILNTNDSAFSIVRNVFDSIPFKWRKYFNEKFLRSIIRIIEENKIDAVWINHAHMGSYGLRIKKQLNIPVFLREHNIEYDLVKQYADYHSNFFHKLIANWQFRKSRSYEIRMWQSFDKTFFISDLDLSEVRKHMRNMSKAELLYDSFGTRFKGMVNTEKESKSIVFTGPLKTIQNKVNLENFLETIFLPLINEDQTWKLYFTGNDPSTKKSDSPNVINSGFVNDIETFVAGKKYFISPTIMGSGVRIKILNAMATGMVCIISETDKKTLKYFSDMINVVVYKDFFDFRQKINYLEANPQEYNRISSNAMKIKDDITWKKYVDKAILAMDM